MSERRFMAKCAVCAEEACVIHVIQRRGEKDMGICKGCPCTSTYACVWCERTGEHWLGCPIVGLPVSNAKEIAS